MQRLVCPNCGYAKDSFPGTLVVLVEAKVTVAIDRDGEPKPALSRRVSMKKSKLGENPVVTCPNCGEEFHAMDIVKFGCSHCGKEIDRDEVDEYFCRAAMDLRCPRHVDPYYCEGCTYANDCELLERRRRM